MLKCIYKDHIVRHKSCGSCWFGNRGFCDVALGGKQWLEHIPGIVYRRDGQVMKSAVFK
jgi:hypothetical protein